MNFGEIDITHEPYRLYFVWGVNKQGIFLLCVVIFLVLIRKNGDFRYSRITFHDATGISCVLRMGYKMSDL